jgi:hypothetical protein
MNKRAIFSGATAGLSLLATCACFYSIGRIGLLALPPAIVFSILFIVFAKLFIRDTIQDHFEVITLRGVKIIGHDISLYDNHLLLIKQGDILHSIEKRDINYIDIINHDGRRRLPILDFLREFPKE